MILVFSYHFINLYLNQLNMFLHIHRMWYKLYTKQQRKTHIWMYNKCTYQVTEVNYMGILIQFNLKEEYLM